MANGEKTVTDPLDVFEEERANMATGADEFVKRVLTLMGERDALNEDIKEVYEEAKASGLKVSSLRQVVSLIRKSEKNREKLEEEALYRRLYWAKVMGIELEDVPDWV